MSEGNQVAGDWAAYEPPMVRMCSHIAGVLSWMQVGGIYTVDAAYSASRNIFDSSSKIIPASSFCVTYDSICQAVTRATTQLRDLISQLTAQKSVVVIGGGKLQPYTAVHMAPMLRVRTCGRLADELYEYSTALHNSWSIGRVDSSVCDIGGACRPSALLFPARATHQSVSLFNQ